MSSPIQNSNPQEQFQKQLKNLAKQDGIWNGYLIVKDSSLTRVNVFEYVGRKLFGQSTSPQDLERATAKYLDQNKDKVTSYKQVKLMSKLAGKIESTQKSEIKNDINDMINEIYWKIQNTSSIKVPDIITTKTERTNIPQNQEVLVQGHHLLSNTNYAQLVGTLGSLNQSFAPEVENKFEDFLKTNPNQAKLLAIACLESRSPAGLGIIKTAFPALLAVNSLHAMEFAKEIAKKNTTYGVEFGEILKTLRPNYPEIAKELGMYSVSPYSSTFNEKNAAEAYENKRHAGF